MAYVVIPLTEQLLQKLEYAHDRNQTFRLDDLGDNQGGNIDIIFESVFVFFGCKPFIFRRDSTTIAPQSSGFSLKKSSKLI